MKINKKIIRLKRFVNSIVIASEARQSRRMTPLKARKSVSLLLVMILSLFLVAVPMAGAAEAADYYVRTDGNDSVNDGSADDASHAWLTIQHAVDTVVAGDTIEVAAGTYELKPDDEGIGIKFDKDDLTLKAAGATEDTIIDFSLCDLAIRIIKVDKATVEGFTMKGGGSGHQAFQVIGLEGNPVSNVNILNNVITGTTDSAINLYGAWGPVTGVTILGNTIDNCQYGIMAGAGVSNSTIWNNKITNSIQDNSNWGAIAFFGTISSITISGNEVSSNENLNGIYLGSGTYNDILVESNIISSNLGGVKIASGVNFTNLVLNFNNIEGNTTGVLNESALLVYAEANWWGAASGPYHPTNNPDGTGDAVSDNVKFVPFLSPNVTITKTGPAQANQGNKIIYTITYKNEGTYNATNVVITEAYPPEVEYVSADPKPDGGNNIWNIGDLAPGGGDTIKVTVRIK